MVRERQVCTTLSFKGSIYSCLSYTLASRLAPRGFFKRESREEGSHILLPPAQKRDRGIQKFFKEKEWCILLPR